MEQLISFLSLDETFFVQFALFLFVFLIMKTFLFGPMLLILEERNARISGDLAWAKELNEKAEAAELQYRGELGEAKRLAKAKFEETVKEAKAKEAQLLAEARKHAEAQVNAFKTTLAEEKVKAQRSLEADIEALSIVVSDRLTRRVG